MKYLLLLVLAAGNPAMALTCETDSECLSEGLSLIKKAVKLNACHDEVKLAAQSVESVASQGDELHQLELCVAKAKKSAKVAKKFQKRQERIAKAMGLK